MDSLARHRARGQTDAYDERDVRDDVVDGAGGLAVLDGDWLYVLDGRRLVGMRLGGGVPQQRFEENVGLDADQVIVERENVVVVGEEVGRLALHRYQRVDDRLVDRGLTRFSVSRPAAFRARAAVFDGTLHVYFPIELVRGRAALATIEDSGGQRTIPIEAPAPLHDLDAPYLHVLMVAALDAPNLGWRGRGRVAGPAAWSVLDARGARIWTHAEEAFRIDGVRAEASTPPPVVAQFVAASGERVLVEAEGELRSASPDGETGDAVDPAIADAAVLTYHEGWWFGSPRDRYRGCSLDEHGGAACLPPDTESQTVGAPSGSRSVPHDVARIVSLPEDVVVFGNHDDEGRGTWMASERSVRVPDVGFGPRRAGDVVFDGSRLALAARSGSRELRVTDEAPPAVIFVSDGRAAVIRGREPMRPLAPVRGFLLAEARVLAVLGREVVLAEWTEDGLHEAARVTIRDTAP